MAKQNSYIFNFSKFIFILFISIIAIGYTLNHIFESNIIFKNKISGASKINRIINFSQIDEIPIFGSSRAEGSYIPSIISEKESFNYGISGTQSNIWLFFLETE